MRKTRSSFVSSHQEIRTASKKGGAALLASLGESYPFAASSVLNSLGCNPCSTHGYVEQAKIADFSATNISINWLLVLKKKIVLIVDTTVFSVCGISFNG